MENNTDYLYEIRDCFLTKNEMNYISAMIKCLPQEYYIQPQVGLRTIINRTDNAQYQNELNRYVDACIFDKNYHPIAVIEINDASHLQKDRKNRDEKVKKICEEAGLPLITLWTSYGINPEYIKKRIEKAIEESKNPVRIMHSKKQSEITQHDINTAVSLPTEQEFPVTSDKDNIKSKKKKYVAVLLSVFLGFIGIPYYYIERPVLGLIASIPFFVLFIISMGFIQMTESAFVFVAMFTTTLVYCVNIVSAIFFGAGVVKDKYGKYIK